MGLALSSTVWGGDAAAYLQTLWSTQGVQQPLKSWNANDLAHLKSVTQSQKDPQDGKNTHWKGVLLSTVIEKSLEMLRPDEKAQVDLLVFKSSSGGEVIIPRWLVTKYPLLLAFERNHAELSAPELVLPWTSHPRILSEGLSIGTLFLPKAFRLELTSYKTRFSSFLLTVRTDPAAVRGEKLFLQNCTTCHSAGSAGVAPQVSPAHPLTLLDLSNRSRELASTGHPDVGRALKMSESERRALVSYLNAYRVEHSNAQAPTASTQ